MEYRVEITNRIIGGLLIVLSLAVSIPLTLKVYLDGGGTWGFGVIGFPVLIPLSFYILYGVTALIRPDNRQRKAFIACHFISFAASAVSMFMFPVYPTLLVSVPLLLAVFGLMSIGRYKYYLLSMQLFAIIANVVLLKWEFDFHRSLPVIELIASV
jgi:hypothetical protein